MPFYRINGMIGGSSFLPSTIQPGFSETSSKTNNREEKEISGSGLEKMNDKLDKLIVKPRRKMKNIQFNP